MPGKWRWLAVVAAAFPSQFAHAATGTTPSAEALLRLHDSGTDFRVSGGASKAHGVKGEAKLDLALGPVTASLSGHAHASRGANATSGSAALSGGELKVDTQWTGKATSLDLKASQKFQADVQDGSVGGALYIKHIESQAGVQTASATAKLAPLPRVRIEIGAASEDQATTQRQWQAGGKPATSRVETRTGREFARARWTPIPRVTVEAEAVALSTTLTMQGSVDGTTAYRTAEPKVTVTLKPWTGSTLSLGVADRQTPLDAAKFAAYAAATGRPADAGLKPDSARELKFGLEQKLGDALALKASYRNAQLDSTTVLMPAASGQTPASITGGRRQRFSASLTLSLAGLGLPHTKLSSQAMWQRSRIRDPLTGHERRISGETPHQASFRLAQDLPQQHLRWGLIGRLGAETHYYQATQETTVAQGGSVGAFVQYNPGPFTLRLDVAGLAGTTAQTSAFYAGTRGASRIDHFGHSEQSSTTVGLTLTKALDG